MSIQYVLFENHLTDRPDDYKAVVQSLTTAEVEDVIERIVEHGSTVTRADILSVLEDFFSAIEQMLREGKNVNTPSANYTMRIKGVFNGATDSFDPARHQVVASVSPGKRLRAVIRRSPPPVSKKQAEKPRPHPLTYTDFTTEQNDAVLTPGGMGQLSGYRLKVDPADANQGIFLVAADKTTTRVEVVGKNAPATLIFMVPALAPGEYTLEVRAMFGKSEVRTGTLDVPLKVVA